MTDSSKDDLLSPAAVAKLFCVDPRTVTRWARAGKLPVVRTMGGHRRYPEVAIRALVKQSFEGRGPIGR